MKRVIMFYIFFLLLMVDYTDVINLNLNLTDHMRMTLFFLYISVSHYTQNCLPKREANFLCCAWEKFITPLIWFSHQWARVEQNNNLMCGFLLTVSKHSPGTTCQNMNRGNRILSIDRQVESLTGFNYYVFLTTYTFFSN